MRELLPELLPPRVLAQMRKLLRRPSPLEAWASLTAIRAEVVADLDLTSRLPMLDDQRRVDWRQVALDLLGDTAGQADSSAAIRSRWRLDYRVPTLDRRVLEAAMRQPEWVRRHRGVDRAVARAAMADRLPDSIKERTSRGAQLPDWLDQLSGEKARVQRELESAKDDPLSNQLIDMERLQRLVQNWPTQERAADTDVINNYRCALLRALLVSRYLRWFGSSG
jgi:asparagine synthase (glutamine-hydrolysing)